jgi:hypothetical protein
MMTNNQVGREHAEFITFQELEWFSKPSWLAEFVTYQAHKSKNHIPRLAPARLRDE